MVELTKPADIVKAMVQQLETRDQSMIQSLLIHDDIRRERFQ